MAALSGLFLFMPLPVRAGAVEDRGQLYVHGTGPEGATLAYTDATATRSSDILAKVPEVESR